MVGGRQEASGNTGKAEIGLPLETAGVVAGVAESGVVGGGEDEEGC